MKKLCIVLGTRPEIIKLAPLIRRIKERQIPLMLIHSNQHYDERMDGIFFSELQLPPPDYHLQAADASTVSMLAKVMQGCASVWSNDRPAAVIVQGDTNTTLGAALAAEKSSIPVLHVEAGLRSDDLTMPEERNRILTDHIAERLYVPTELQAQRLRAEAISADSILISGNTILDAVNEHRALAAKTTLPDTLSDLPKRYAILTLHRPALVDQPDLLASVLMQIGSALESAQLTGVLLAHPRTRKMLDGLPALPSAILLHEPVGYFPMLKLLAGSTCVITDSGGLQEETAILHIPCLTLRDNTERPETLRSGGNILVSPQSTSIASALQNLLMKNINWQPLYSEEHPSDVMLADITTRYL